MSAVLVDIANSALIRLGCNLISDLSENTKEARLCNHQLPRTINSILRSAPWAFAVRRATLTTVVATLEFGDENVFQLPADCLRVWKTSDYTDTYKIEGRYLLSEDFDTAEIHYVTSAATPADYDFTFQEAVSCALAAALAYSLTQSAALKDGLLAESEFYINQARSYNSQEQTPDSYKFDTFLDARHVNDEIY
jgi:hypothetical protein